MGYWFDIDGVLADTFRQLLQEVSIALGADAEPERVTSYYSLHLAWPGHTEQANRRVRMLFDSHLFYQRVRPRLGAAEALSVLHEQGKVLGYITSRPTHTRESTQAWLDAYGFPPVQLVHAFDKSLVMRWTGGTLVDDNPKTVHDTICRGGEAILFSAPYNLDAIGMRRIGNLWELVEGDYVQSDENR